LTRLFRLGMPARVAFVALLVLVAACQSSGSSGGGKPTVRIGSTNFTEQSILAELYAQALEANGYRVERRLNLGPREIVEPALESSQIDMYAEYMATLLAFVAKTPGGSNGPAASSDPAATGSTLQSALQPKGIATLDYAPAVDTNGFVVTKATADKYRLTKLSDLAPVASQLVLGGAPECPERPFCLPGLRDTYGLTFKDFKPLDAGGPLTVAALEGNQVDVGLIFTTDAVIATRGFVLLADDKHLQLADNVVPVVRADFLSKAPADFKTQVNAVSAKLTTEELTGLNKAVSVDRKEPRDVAAAWLRDKGLVK
jgi:osmoprotectant transport system substrate-binding protein